MTDHQICDACECVSHCRKNGCVPFTPMPEKPRFAIPPSTDVKTLQAELDIALSMLVRERGVVKELAAALRGYLDYHTKPAGVNAATIIDKPSFANLMAEIEKKGEGLAEAARAALSRVPQ